MMLVNMRSDNLKSNVQRKQARLDRLKSLYLLTHTNTQTFSNTSSRKKYQNNKHFQTLKHIHRSPQNTDPHREVSLIEFLSKLFKK